MLFKVVVLFLAAMAVLAMFGKLRLPGRRRPKADKCPSCGRYRIGQQNCSCGKG